MLTRFRTLKKRNQWKQHHQMRFKSSFKSVDLSLKNSTSLKEKLPLEELKFGASFTDHMLTIENSGGAWKNPKIEPFADLKLSPAALTLHYAIQCFEGMKAYKDEKGRVRLFRPMKNIERLQTSSQRLALPSFDGDEFLECMKELLRVDSDWVPTEKGYSLYIRPTFIATTGCLGVAAPSDSLLYVIMSPVGPYFPSGFKPVKLYADENNVRAWPGGAGSYKVGGNYAPTILPQKEAMKKGYSQILWLENNKITECGTMNMFIYWTTPEGETELVTPPLSGTILPGITRLSILELAAEWGEFKVSERFVTMEEFIEAHQDGRIIETFGAGTACIVCPIASIHFQGVDYQIPTGEEVGPLTRRIWDRIQEIQYGEVSHEWSEIVE
eukprot:TRINITY_DN5734_c0_g1_i4.p1 TRINITY_DN5734_c0_g1~~TRINITY_DN5734_c0_g1_i4.p1  ORF type:complete len:384 (+),score=79.39 TRINITY_DN5734_c0_g1_i4:39-1190(+)